MFKLGLLLWGTVAFSAAGQIGAFISVSPNPISDTLLIPNTHTFQVLVQEGDNFDGHAFRGLPDFTCFVPDNGFSSTSGILSINHELSNIRAGVSLLDISFDLEDFWSITAFDTVDFSDQVWTQRPCSGGLTSWGTVMLGEENMGSLDVDTNGYLDIGWLVEFDPQTGEMIDYDNDGIGDKLWRMGRMRHENVCFLNDSVAVYGSDDATYGYLYKFIADSAKWFSEGDLFVLCADSLTGSTGVWKQVPNSTPTECNDVSFNAQALGATNFNSIEDCELGPDGKIYFAAKVSSRIYRLFVEDTITSSLEIYVENQNYTFDHLGGSSTVNWGYGADNLVFDNMGNLWVCQDGVEYNIYVVRPGHTNSNPKVELFARTPKGGEPTGITFTPDYKFMFMSIMHPYTSNASEFTDVAGKQFRFNKGTTLVIGRKESFARPFFKDKQDLKILDRCLFFENNGSSVNLEIYNVLGQLIFKKNTTDNFIRLGHNVKGLCVLRLRINDAETTGSFYISGE